MKEFVLTKDIDGFIRKIAIQKPQLSINSGYSISNLIESVFGSKDRFCTELKEFKGSTKYKDEFLQFEKDFSEASIIQIGKIFPASYFKVIPVEKDFNED